MSDVAAPADLQPGGQALDAFEFHPHWRSVVRGLGGTGAANDPHYAFHTGYVGAAPGPCNFTVRFDGLTARYGVLQLRVHMIATEPGALARVANMDRIAMNRLVHRGGEVSIRFEGFRGYTFAIMGLVPDETDAEALGLSVTLDRPLAAADDAEAGDGRTSAYGRDAARPIAHLVSAAAATFATPVSQACTAAQLDEPAFRALGTELAGLAPDGLGGWTDGFVLQVLRRYGVLAPGARGLGFGAVDEGLADRIRAAGPAVDLVRFAAAGPGRPVVADALPRDLADHDFLWSTDALGALASADQGGRFVEDAMRCLRPGGLAVHVMPYALDKESRGAPLPGPIYRRGDVERMAVLAISRNHEVAQLKVDHLDALTLPGRADVGAFGLVLRRAPAIV